LKQIWYVTSAEQKFVNFLIMFLYIFI
jgi:hypothetical protein